MPTELDVLALSGQVAAVEAENAHRWKVALVPSSLRVHVNLTPAGFNEQFALRIDFCDGLGAPPSVVFCDPETRVEGRSKDWPAGLTNYFKLPPKNGALGWICTRWTREGRLHHAEWNSFGWKPNRALWRVLTAIQDILDAPGAFAGRAA